MGGALPLRSLLAAVFGPPDRGCHGHPGSTVFIGRVLHLIHPMGVGPKAPWPPPAGGGDALARGSRGVPIYLVFPGVSPPDAPPALGARLCRLLVVTIPILPIFTSHIVD